MTTRAEVRALLREVLSDKTRWSNAKLNAWIADAIRDYSNYFRRQVETTISCVADQREYTLSLSGISDVLLVQFPKGMDPPRYLTRRPETGKFIGLPVYDLRGYPPRTLILAEEPAAGEEIFLIYSAAHAAPANDSTTLTMPDIHLEAIKLFVQWQAIKELELNESLDPDKTSMLLGLFGINAVRAERIYRTKLEEYRKKMAVSGFTGPWVMDEHDRVY